MLSVWRPVTQFIKGSFRVQPKVLFLWFKAISSSVPKECHLFLIILLWIMVSWLPEDHTHPSSTLRKTCSSGINSPPFCWCVSRGVVATLAHFPLQVGSRKFKLLQTFPQAWKVRDDDAFLSGPDIQALICLHVGFPLLVRELLESQGLWHIHYWYS